MNHFEFYGIPVALSVDETLVRKQYLLNSQKYHPDFHTLADETEQARMLELSTQNNEAFKILSDKDRRIQYVLELNGLLGQDKQQESLPQDFLMEMMDINEALMELEFDSDPERFASSWQQAEKMENALENQIQPTLSTWTEVSGKAEDLLPLREYFFKKRYLLRIKENLSKFAPA